jgi:hypothetical protein
VPANHAFDDIIALGAVHHDICVGCRPASQTIVSANRASVSCGPIDAARVLKVKPNVTVDDHAGPPRRWLKVRPLDEPRAGAFEEIIVRNEDDVFRDHTAYWQNGHEVVGPRLLAWYAFPASVLTAGGMAPSAFAVGLSVMLAAHGACWIGRKTIWDGWLGRLNAFSPVVRPGPDDRWEVTGGPGGAEVIGLGIGKTYRE